MPITAQRVIELLQLQPHPEEGGYFRETYRSDERIPSDALPTRYVAPTQTGAGRSHATHIYYLLTPETYSQLHLVESDEAFHFYLGDPIEQLRLQPDGSHETVLIGCDLEAGHRPQSIVPRGVWQGARLAPLMGEPAETTTGTFGFALVGCSVAPGFDFADYRGPGRALLIERYPEARAMIERLCP